MRAKPPTVGAPILPAETGIGKKLRQRRRTTSIPGRQAFGHCTRVGTTYEESLAVTAHSEHGLVGVGGFEPPTSWSQTTRSSLAELHPD
jgi:hypothetical protein